MTEWRARLDKSGSRVLCARISCGADLAMVKDAKGEIGGVAILTADASGAPEDRDLAGAEFVAFSPDARPSFEVMLGLTAELEGLSVKQLMARQPPSVVATLERLASEYGKPLEAICRDAENAHDPHPEVIEWVCATRLTRFSLGCSYTGDRRSILEVDEEPARRDFVFGLGWRPNADGVWAMTKRSSERLKAGRTPSFRRDPFGRGNRRDTGVGEMLPRKLPVTIKCPSCGLVQVAVADDLRLSPLPEFTVGRGSQ